MTRNSTLPISGRPIPETPAWLQEAPFLLEAGAQSLKTETTYRSGLRLFADWLQHYGRDGFAKEDPWPLSPERLTTATILNFRNWLLANRSQSTVTTYMAAVVGYLHFLDGQDQLPETVQLGKLQRQLARRQVERNQAEAVIDLDIARQAMPQIVKYYNDLPLPAENDRYNRRLSLLRDRAVVAVLYSTAARLSEVIALNRSNVDHGRARYAAITGKGNRSRTIHLRDYARQAIRAYLVERGDSNPALFVAHSRNARNARLSATAAHNVVKKAVRALHLHESLSAHDFRHFRATQLLREGMPLEVVQEFLGHVDISTTRGIYAPVLGVQVVSEWLDNVDVPPEQALAPQEPEEAGGRVV
ncbi:MAG: site-specific integrase [Chloroflexi bacterium]|nr:site-specific integrase [Chloroflexota bacterium]MCI0578543.1 site-specific integrase [Chloroflexota bacterium]MCI0647461.1 site-specific integrase [Chloroflexota bacterium]MCI0728741.1 site-specific integrase [Chloroflexota bacterium]